MIFLRRFFVFSLSLLLILSLVACSGVNFNTSMSYTFNVENGEKIKVTFDTTDNYSFKQSDGNMYFINNENLTILQGYFILSEMYDRFLTELFFEDVKLADGRVFHKNTDVEDADFAFLYRPTGANIGVLLYNKDSSDLSVCESVLERITFEVVNSK